MNRFSIHNSVFKTTFSALFLAGLTMVPGQLYAQEANQDKVKKPLILYSGTPKQYEIGGIRVTGGEGYEDYVLIGLSGLSVGQTITVPGDAVTQAVKRYWNHGLFSQAKIEADSIIGNKIYLNIALVQRPRISDIAYHGVKKSEREDLEASLGMMKGGQVTPNIIDRAKRLAKRYFDDKGFKNAEIIINQRDDPNKTNQVIVDINIDKSMIEMVFGKVVAFAKQQGVAIPDYLMPNEWNEPQTQSYEQFREYLYDLYASIPEGVTETYLHPAKESDDLKGTSSVWERRVWEYRVMSDPATKQHIEAHGIKLINYRDLAAMRKA